MDVKIMQSPWNSVGGGSVPFPEIIRWQAFAAGKLMHSRIDPFGGNPAAVCWLEADAVIRRVDAVRRGRNESV